MDRRLLLFSLVISVLTGIIFGVVPALRATRGNLGSTTCAAALNYAMERTRSGAGRQPLFLASLGPGLLFGGGWLELPLKHR